MERSIVERLFKNNCHVYTLTRIRRRMMPALECAIRPVCFARWRAAEAKYKNRATCARVTGCSEDDAGVVDTEVGGGCAGGAPTAGGGSVVGDGGGSGNGGTCGGVGSGGDSEGGSSAKQQQGGERCPQCGIPCRDVRVLQLHLEDTHKTSCTIDKHDLNAQFSQVVSDRDDPSRTHTSPEGGGERAPPFLIRRVPRADLSIISPAKAAVSFPPRGAVFVPLRERFSGRKGGHECP